MHVLVGGLLGFGACAVLAVIAAWLHAPRKQEDDDAIEDTSLHDLQEEAFRHWRDEYWGNA